MWINMINGYGWGGMGIGMIGMAIFRILVLVLIVALVKGMMHSGARQPEKTALDILQERYAAGEIERDKYEQKKCDLGG